MELTKLISCVKRLSQVEGHQDQSASVLTFNPSASYEVLGTPGSRLTIVTSDVLIVSG